MGNDHLDAQVAARLVKRALNIVGGTERLAEILGVPGAELGRWMAGQAFPPEGIFERVLEIVLDARDKRASGAATSASPRVLVAASPESAQVICSTLGDEFGLVIAHTLTDALDLVQAGTVVRSAAIDAIVCGQHFEGSQMLRFLECVKAYPPSRGIPFIGCRAASTHLGDGSLRAMREACEALGAVAYVDLPEHERYKGAEAAAVEFRDAVRAAVRLPRAIAGLRVLVVDDNPDAAHTLSVLLRMAGHEVIKSAGADEALRQVRLLAPDVAIIDIAMPRVSGYTLAERLRREPWGRDVTLIALTGHGASEDAARARQFGFDHHFLKPVTLERLLGVFPAPKK